ncbi:YcnI family copper-binding membrane protein [Microbacterium testaceum]|uniref:Membrane protein n=1 Tax=Microbacterium testaceum TaxID=2033 RepID=A0A4Y3QKU3_MICTE|nr:YcnI family protein [Microbacterium testaceum]MDZ5144895.1 YcnI family protein [Microbacterium testaceum]WJS91106.1 YcnI family protein [Microbacterium testaceum]GEB45805.1 membrane protein [Microbacterium testaceum]
MSRKTTLRRALAGLAAGAALAIAVPLAASAHVTVNPNTATPGSYATVNFRVPTESETASTVKLEVTLPTDTPLTSVLVEPVPGWTATVEKGALPAPVEVDGNTVSDGPLKIVWQADPGVGIGQDQFQIFSAVLGPIPDTGHLVLPAVQTYSDGSVVDWTNTPEQVAADDTLEPAPVLYINDTPPASGHGGHSGHGSASAAPTMDDHSMEASSQTGDSSGLSLGLSIAALVIAVVGALLGAFAVSRRPKRS